MDTSGYQPNGAAVLRRATLWFAAVIAALALAYSTLFALSGEYPSHSLWGVLGATLCAGLAIMIRSWKPQILALGAAMTAVFTHASTIMLWVALTALVFVSLTEDPRRHPWAGWLGGFGGVLLSLLIWTPPEYSLIGSVLLGGATATLLRSRITALHLEREASVLRDRTAQLEDRASLARELHDVLGHHVTAIVVQAESGKVKDARTALDTIATLGRSTLGELDTLVAHLRQPSSRPAPTPRLQEIDKILALPLRRQGVEVEVHVEPRLARDGGLDPRRTFTIYRIAQEALTNVAKHAGARRVWIDVRSTDDGAVQLHVVDDGHGPDGSRAGRGTGLIGMRERAEAVSGTLTFQARAGGGTMLEALLPLTNR